MSAYVVNNGAPTISTRLTLDGTGGQGYLHLTPQSATPVSGGGSIRVFSDNSSRLAWIDATGHKGTLDSLSMTASRVWELPDASGAIILDDNIVTLSNKTILSTDGNDVDATQLVGAPITGVLNNNSILQYNDTALEWQTITLSATTPLSYSSGVFSIAVGTSAGTVAAGNDLRFNTPRVIRVKSSNPGVGEFTSVNLAIASITDASAIKRYLVDVLPGIYAEPPTVVPAYVTVSGSGNGNTILASGYSQPALTASANSAISNLQLAGQFGTSGTAIAIDGGSPIYISNLLCHGFATIFYVKANAAATNALITQCYFAGPFGKGVHIDGRAATGTNPNIVTLSNIICAGNVSTTAAIWEEGPYANTVVSNVQAFGATSGVGLHMEDGAVINISGGQFSSNAGGIFIANVGSAPNIKATNVSIFGSSGQDIQINHPGTSGVFMGVVDKSKVVIDPSAPISLFLTDPANSGSVIVGDFYLGDQSSTAAEISDLITRTAPIGEFTGGGVITVDSGLDINISGGSGYIVGATPRSLIKVTWVDSIITLGASGTHYIYADSGGLDSALSLPDSATTILLGRVVTDATSIEFIDSQIVNSQHWFQEYLHFSRDIFGVKYHSGSLLTANASRQLAISSGHYYYLNSEFLPAGQASPATWSEYHHVAGIYAHNPQTVVSNTQYDNGTNLVAITAGKYVKHAFYIVNQGVNEKYLLVYGQAQYDTQLEAEAGPTPNPPPYFEQGVAEIAEIVVQEGNSSIVSILDVRPQLGSGGGSAAAVTDHGNLTGLGDDDHMQYLLVNGSRAMSGALNMGGNNVTSAGTINGVTVETHASRHLPNGADSLTTAAPLASLSSATTNATGTANSFARSDHSHTIDITGFNINTLANTLGVPKGGTGQTALTSGRFLVGAGTSAVDLTKVVPAGTVVGDTDSQTLTNKTIVGGSSGNDIAANKILGVTVGITAPTTNQVLVATSGTAAAWTSITDSVLSGAINVPHGGTGLTTLTSGRFLIGAGTSNVDLTKAAPTGDVVGTSDAQTLTNKTVAGGSSGNDIAANKILGVNIDTTIPATGQILVATNGTNAAWGLITDSNISGTITVPHGGTGLAILTSGRFLIGAGTSNVDLTKVVPTGAVVGTSDTQTLTNKTVVGGSSGNDIAANKILGVVVGITAPTVNQALIATSGTAATWSAITDSVLSGAIAVPHGGTGLTTLTSGRFLVGAGTSSVNLAKVVPTGVVVGDSDAQTLTNKTIVGGSSGNDIAANKLLSVILGITAPTANQVLIATSGTAAAWGTITDSIITGPITVPKGGTGRTTLTSGFFLAGAGTSNVDLSKAVPSGAVVGDSDVQTLTNKTVVGGSLGNDIAANKILGVAVDVTSPTANQVLVATSGSAAAWTAITDSSISGVITVPHGGTGLATLTSGRFLIGAGTSNVDLTKVVPTGAVVGTSDTQTLTNKTVVGGSSGNDIAANKILGVDVGVTAPTANQVLVATSGTAAVWTSITDSVLSGAINVPHGGTGLTTLTSGRFLIGAGTGNVDLTKVAPSGVVVGDTDSQTLTNKTIIGGSSGNDIAANKILGVAVGVTAPTADQVLVATSGTAAAWSAITDSSISGAINVPHGGTGLTTLTSGRFLVGAGVGNVDLTKVVPSGIVVGTSDAQTLTNKTIIGGSSGNDIAANKILGVVIGITAPTANQVLIATSGTAASWTSITDSVLSGAIAVPHGGTGLTTLTSGRFLIGAGTGNVDLTKAAPTGTVVGDTDSQTLTNKTIVGGSSGNDIAANKLLGVTVGITAPTSGQAFIASSGTAAAWTSITDSVISGAIAVPHGGTGLATLTSGRFLVGAGTSNVDLTKVVPTGAVVGDTDSQTLTNKTIVGGSSGNDIAANKILGVAVGVTAPTSGQVLVATSGTAGSWALVTDSSISGAITVPHGGTGVTTLTSGNFLIGAGTSAVTTTKAAPVGVVVGTTDTQTLTNKTLLSTTNTIDATRLQTVGISASAPTSGQVLTYNGAAWAPATSSGGGAQALQRWTIKDVKAVGTSAGSMAANTWTTRTLTTLAGSADTSVTIASNQITFTAGTYFIRAMVPGHRLQLHKARLRSITGAADLAYGTSAGCGNSANTLSHSVILEYITFGSTTVVEVQHYGTRAQASNGLGIATGIAGTNEIYTTIEIEKLN